jgi:hypothetical protein
MPHPCWEDVVLLFVELMSMAEAGVIVEFSAPWVAPQFDVILRQASFFALVEYHKSTLPSQKLAFLV